MNWKILILSVFLSLTFGCSKKTQQITPPFHGDYPAAEMRSMWSFCVMNFTMKAPLTPRFLVAQMCDCYLDEMRKKHPAKEVNKLDDVATREMGQHLIKVCNINPEPKKT